MEHRQLGRSGLKVPVLSLGAATFGGTNAFFEHWGQTQVAEATRMVDLCMEHGMNFFDTSDGYSDGASEEILGQALKGRRHNALISTKTNFPTGNKGPNDKGSSRYHITRACEASLKRLGTDHIDLYFMHAFDALTPVDETLRALDDLVSSGKVGYIGASNFSGWHLMKSLATSEKNGLARYVVYQGYYSLIGRHYEWELMPLGWGRLTGKIRRDQPVAQGRIATGGGLGAPPVTDGYLYRVVDALEAVAHDYGKTVPQVAINWLLQRPTVANVVIGARNEEQMKQNLGALGWALEAEAIARLDDASRETPIYPYWHQMQIEERNPKPTRW
ncbi:aldo/keto reductase [Hydrogenophaga sp. 2FB]|uniref:aldo/keto reductase n=1 Tax=Hydrogenophaga sp. 2FB TaxID=2502187 RepID=UPI0010F95260|nr:aldo/keto reductase [Hydrogenophaga sp. 2FB]